MSDKQTFRLVHAVARNGAVAAVRAAPEGHVVTVRPPSRSLDQNALLHTALTEISEQIEWHGKRLSVVVWKRLCMASWLREKGEAPDLVPALDGNGFDVIYEHTSQLSVAECSELLEWCFSFGAQNGVKFRDY